jgi:hypothetical protein
MMNTYKEEGNWGEVLPVLVAQWERHPMSTMTFSYIVKTMPPLI